MNGKRIIYYLLAAFIFGNVLLIYIQYNTSKNIKSLIRGNEKVLDEIDVTNNLRELNRDVASINGGTATATNTLDPNARGELEVKIKKIQFEIDNLQKISDDDTSVKYIDILDLLVHEKLALNKTVDGLSAPPPLDTAERKTRTNRAKQLNDSIRNVTRVIESSRQKLLAAVTKSIDKSGDSALSFGTTLIVLVLLSGAALFWFIITSILKQNQLIGQLNTSQRKLKEAARIKENFLANMSHEIRTPLNSILGFNNLLLQKKLDDESMKYVQTIQKSGDNLLAIINDVLDLSKIEAGMMRIESAPFSIQGLAQSVENMFRTRAAEKNIDLVLRSDPALPQTLEGDATRLTQILVNLIGNALKFTDRGKITVTLTHEGKQGNTLNTGITVSDTGIGIEKQHLKQIFERFRQAEDSVTRKYGGTGLGLSIVNDLVHLQQGTINVESEPGKGTTFRLVIPYKISTETPELTRLKQQAPSQSAGFEMLKLLVAEDNEFNQSLIQHLFKNWGLAYDLAVNGRDAIAQLRTNHYDLVLMDIQMPEMDGYSATTEIRNNLKSTVPIIAMTAHALEGEKEKCLALGMNDYIAKPLSMQLLQSLITRYAKQQGMKEGQNPIPGPGAKGPYRFINLQYMKEVSLGDNEYEKNITGQFIDAIPEDLTALEKAWHDHQIPLLRKTAHNMKTSVSIMGLNDLLQPYLDKLEHGELSEKIFREAYSSLSSLCNKALAEARRLYADY